MSEAARLPLESLDRPDIVGRSPVIHRAVHLVERFAPTGLPILLLGPTGTGKELFARLAHCLSGRHGDLVDVNCGAVPADLADSLLFGHRRGSFSGAVETTTGLLEAADGGTLFLDELGSLPLDVQAKLLRVLETGVLTRVGETARRSVDVRVVAAAQDDLSEHVRALRFRSDLYQRLSGVVIELPPLSARPEDVAPLALAFAARLGRAITACGVSFLERQVWPGNVRQLRLAVERAVWLVRGELSAGVLAESFSLGALEGQTPVSASDELMELCRNLGWDIPAILDSTGLSRSTLYRRLRQRGVQPSRERKRW